MRGLVGPENTNDYGVDPVELFFDSAYVIAFERLAILFVATPVLFGSGQTLRSVSCRAGSDGAIGTRASR
jgi:low temperature requirement protein LtrA